MGRTSSEVKNRWMAKVYKRYTLYLRKEDDKEYIAYLDKRRSETGESLADIVKEGLDELMK
jgi:hypothetical protein